MLAVGLARVSSSELLQRRQLETPSTQQSCARPPRRSARALTVLHYLNAFDTVMICRCSLSPYESFSSQTHWCPCSLFPARPSTSLPPQLFTRCKINKTLPIVFHLPRFFYYNCRFHSKFQPFISHIVHTSNFFLTVFDFSYSCSVFKLVHSY